MQNRDKDSLHTGVCVHISRCEDKNMSVGNNGDGEERGMRVVFE